jgi:tripartite-type tricarboxylate transporter receptor subunit TctC
MGQENLWLVGAVASALATILVHPAMAQQPYPVRPIRIIYPFLAGTGNDGIARVVSQRLTAEWAQPVVVENRAGAGGTIGAELVAKSAPDGYTLLISTASLTVNATLFPKLPLRDLVPVTQIMSGGVVVVVHPSVPARSLKELIALAKTRKDGLNFGSNGTGTTSHLAGAWLQHISGAKINHIPYKGQTAAVPALVSGDVEIGIPGTGAPVPGLIASNKLRGIAVTMQRKSRMFPELPTVASMFPGFDVDNWVAMWAPVGTPSALIEKLQAEVVKSLQHADMKPSLQNGDNQPVGSSPAEFGLYFNREIEKYAKIIKMAGLKPDE